MKNRFFCDFSVTMATTRLMFCTIVAVAHALICTMSGEIVPYKSEIVPYEDDKMYKFFWGG